MKFKILFVLSILLFFTGRLNAQSYYFKHYQVENGLSNNTIFCSLQDKKGFLWFGTRDGLNRFDGYSFKVFRNDPDNSKSIGSDYIISLYQDKNEVLWVGTSKGLFKYDASTESFELVKSTLNNEVSDIRMDDRGNLWFISESTLCRYNQKSGEQQSYSINKFFSATSITFSSDNTLWVATRSGTVEKYNPVNDSFVSYNVFQKSPQSASKRIMQIYDTGKNSLLIGTLSQGVKLFDIKAGTYQDILTYNSEKIEIYVRDFVQYSPSEYWIATESGVFIYNIETGKSKNLIKKYSDPYSISDNAVYTLCKDKEGGIWVGTYFGGLNYYPRQFTYFEKFFPQIGSNSLSGNAVREITQDNSGNLWVGTEDAGLNKIDSKTSLFTNFKPTGNKGSISYSNIHGLLVNGNELWIGTHQHGLDVMDLQTEKVIRHYDAGTKPGDLKSNFIISIYKTRSGDVLVGTGFGLHKYNAGTNTFSLVNYVPQNASIFTIKEDSSGTIWVGTNSNGIYYYNPASGKSGNLQYEPGNKNSLSSNSIINIFEDSHKNLWFATGNGGVNQLNPDKKTFTKYSTRNGLPSNYVFKILEDNKNNLWITTSKGLVYLDPKTKNIKIYTQANGLLNDQFNYSSGFKDATGTMYFGSAKGLIKFNPSGFIKNNFTPAVYITGFQVNNKELVPGSDDLKKSTIYTSSISVRHNQSSFSIDFAALNFTAPEMTEYQYKMEGIDNDWIYLKANRKVYFTDLSPGRYTFLVKASNSSGVWNTIPTRLEIEILPPFYASTWAWLFYLTVVAGGVFYIIRRYHDNIHTNNQRKIDLLENEKQKEIYQAKIEFFTNITHEIRTPLTLIKGPMERVISKSANFPEIHDSLMIMEKNTDRLLNLTNQLLDFRRTETKGFSLSFVKTDISSFLQATWMEFKTAAEQKEITVKISLLEQNLYAYVDQEALKKILSNLFNNAIKYAKSRVEISLLVNTENSVFEIDIRNDGHLIPADMSEKIFEPFYRLKENEKQQGTGIGLPLARSLAELHDGTLKVLPSQNDRNCILLTLPVRHEAEFNLYPDPAETIAEPKIEENISAKPVILVVDDNTDILDFIASELIANYTVIKAANGEDAVKILKQKSIHLIISDVLMPVMGGFELCRFIKTTLEYSHTPIILLTAKNTFQSKIEGLESGADAYIEKPFSPEHLNIQVSNLLKNRNSIKEYFANSPLVHIKSISYSKADEAFLEKLNDAIYKNIEDNELDVDFLASTMNMSRPTLYRKIKAISNLTPNELINIVRLKKAAELLVSGDYKIYEIAGMVGYSSQTSFGRNFHKQFGMTPSEYIGTKLTERELL